MKKIIIFCCLLFLIVLGADFLSYAGSKERAESVEPYYRALNSQLMGQLILFIGDVFSPYRISIGEHKYVLTGVTFDVYVSLFGRVLNDPSK